MLFAESHSGHSDNFASRDVTLWHRIIHKSIIVATERRKLNTSPWFSGSRRKEYVSFFINLGLRCPSEYRHCAKKLRPLHAMATTFETARSVLNSSPVFDGEFALNRHPRPDDSGQENRSTIRTSLNGTNSRFMFQLGNCGHRPVDTNKLSDRDRVPLQHHFGNPFKKSANHCAGSRGSRSGDTCPAGKVIATSQHVGCVPARFPFHTVLIMRGEFGCTSPTDLE